MAKKTLKCPKCDRMFSMQAHLARHVSAAHSKKKKKAKKKTAKRRKKTAAKRKKKKAAKRAKKTVVRRKKKQPGRKKRTSSSKKRKKKVGRPRGSGGRRGLKKLSLEALTNLIGAARKEAKSRLKELEASIG